MSFKYIIDSSAWVAYLRGSKAGSVVNQLIEEGLCAVSILSIAELADKYEREGKTFQKTLQFIESKVTITPLSVSIALKAAKIKTKQRKKKSKFGLVDAIHIATAQMHNVVFVTTDHDFQDLDNVMVL